MGLLDGKVAIVTGAGRGIGREHALELARNGAKVVVNDLGAAWDGTGTDDTPAGQVVAEIKGAGGEAAANYDNIATLGGSQSLVQQAIDAYGTVDILVNNAGILRDKMIFNMSEDDWDAVSTVHGKGHFLMAHHLAAYWRAKAKETGEPVNGRMIHTSSESGLYGNAGQANYAFAKLGIAALSLVIARELGRYGVTSNAIAPRARTRMTEMSFGELSAGEGFDVLAPGNVSPFVAWLASDEAAHVSGQVFVVYGGTVQLIQQPVVVNQIRKDGRWSVDEFAAATKELFGDRETGPHGTGLPDLMS